MSYSDIGLFWQDTPTTRSKSKMAAVMPDIPETGWKPPKDFPNLSAAKVISFDTETYDPELTTKGPGWARGRGHIVGVSIGVDGGQWYFPMRHEIEPENNIDPSKVLAWLSDTLNTPRIAKVGANIIYDIGWLRQEGVIVSGALYDVQYAEALLNEGAKVALDTLAAKYLDERKESDLLYRWCADYYGGAVSEKQRANIYRTPARLAGPYAESDANLPLRIMQKQYDFLDKENMLDLFSMENRLIPLLVDMRFAGVRVNVDKAEEVRDTLLHKEKEYSARLQSLTGFEVNVNASASLAKAFDTIGLKYATTEKGNPSFTKSFLKGVTHPVGELIREIKTCQKMRGTFIESYILDSHVNGMLYCEFHPLRGEAYGTRSGRYSSSHPNLQNIPSRDDVLATLLRGMFMPDIGHVAWRKYDYSQIEYRFLVHFAVGPGADEVRMLFRTDPKIDYHALTQDLVKTKTGIYLKRKPIKNVNFGLIYGMGEPALAAQIGIPLKEAKKLFKAYHQGAPFAKATMEACIDEAQRTGVITTILNRKSRFDSWEPAIYSKKKSIPLPYEMALVLYGRVKRAHTHKALNRRLQGSAADLLKMAMLKCYEDGVFNVTGVPRLTVHDELDFSDPGGVDAAFEEMRHIMETCLSLKVPVKADCEIGPDWGHVKEPTS